MEVYVSVMRVDAALTVKEETDLKGRLSAARQEKIDRLRYAADRRLSLGAGLLLDQGLKRFGLRERTEAFANGGKWKTVSFASPGNPVQSFPFRFYGHGCIFFLPGRL